MSIYLLVTWCPAGMTLLFNATSGKYTKEYTVLFCVTIFTIYLFNSSTFLYHPYKEAYYS